MLAGIMLTQSACDPYVPPQTASMHCTSKLAVGYAEAENSRLLENDGEVAPPAVVAGVLSCARILRQIAVAVERLFLSDTYMREKERIVCRAVCIHPVKPCCSSTATALYTRVYAGHRPPTPFEIHGISVMKVPNTHNPTKLRLVVDVVMFMPRKDKTR